MFRLLYCYIREPLPGRRAPGEGRFTAKDSKIVHALEDRAAREGLAWEIKINNACDMMEDILDDYDGFICSPYLNMRVFPSQEFKEKVTFLTSYEYETVNIDRVFAEMLKRM